MEYQQPPPKKNPMIKVAIGCAIIVALGLVLIPTIAILASIALPMYSSYKRRGYAIQVVKSIDQVGDALIKSYIQEGQFPEFNDTDELSQATGVMVYTDKVEYAMDKQRGVIALKAYFVGKEYDGETFTYWIDCTTGECQKKYESQGTILESAVETTLPPSSVEE